MNNSNSDFDPTMAANEMFELIINKVKQSNLNFWLEMTPFSAKITLKKTLIRDQSGNPVRPLLHNTPHVTLNSPQQCEHNEQIQKMKEEFENAVNRNEKMESVYNIIRGDLEDALLENETKDKNY